MRPALLLVVLSALLGCGSPAPPPVAVPPLVVTVVPRAGEDAVADGTPDREPPAAGAEASPAEAALQEWSKRTQCSAFDYFPNGGLQNFWCHRPARVTIAALRTLAGGRIFSSGPHTDDDLVLDAKNDFGHYDPAFVRWLVDTAGPSPRGSAAQRATQASYDEHLRPLAEIFWKTLEKARREPACFQRERTAYADAMKRKRLPEGHYERWFYFMNPQFCNTPKKTDRFLMDNGFDGGVNGNVTKSVVGFWLRRSLDGTMDTFAVGLEKLLASYQPELLDGRTPPLVREDTR